MRRRELIFLVGGAAIVPRALRAQQKPMPVIGFLLGGKPGPDDALVVAAFLQGLSETGYVEGQNVAIDYRWAEGRYDRLPSLAADLVARKVDVITAGNFPAALAAKRATSTIPIIFEVSVDPVERGLVASFSRPGGNLTGMTSISIELTPKRVELLTDLVPQASVIALLMNPNNPTTERVMRDVLEAANAKGVQLRILKAGAESEIGGAFASLVELHAGALVLAPDPLFNTRRELLVTLASRHAVPAIYFYREFVSAGGLISYGPSFPGIFRQVGNYVGQILQGANPADLPVRQPTKFELVVNLGTAKALGLTVPPSILARADEVIE
jgi:putative tryptophan/tyrosine transport system substrate-binding protein